MDSNLYGHKMKFMNEDPGLIKMKFMKFMDSNLYGFKFSSFSLKKSLFCILYEDPVFNHKVALLFLYQTKLFLSSTCSLTDSSFEV
jgi:hypothetical protein